MPFPDGWPPRPATNHRSIRFSKSASAPSGGGGPGLFSDSAYIFEQGAGANPIKPTPVVPHGDERTVAEVGTTAEGGSPLGTGQATLGVTEPMIWAGTIRLCNDHATVALEFSFDGTKVDGKVLPTESLTFRHRYEAGIAVRRVSGVHITHPFRIMAW